MKNCVKCGKIIINGVNGCSMFKDCFDCRGGYPDYSQNKSLRQQEREYGDYEGLILARQETDFD